MTMQKSRKNRNSVDSPVFFRRDDCLTLAQARYYQDLLYRTVKVGTELEFAMPKGARREEFQPGIEKLLKPSKDMNRLGDLGVFDVVKEHCGIELQIIGRHPHWEALVSQYDQILSGLLDKKIRMKYTCGLHFHMIGIGLSESIPDIVLANLWNIQRKYAPGLKFLTSAGFRPDGLCRRRQHNAHYEFMRLSPANMKMVEIQKVLKDSLEVPEHQNFFNLEHAGFDENQDVFPFHIELRYPDGDLSAVSISAKTFLMLAMLLKAVEISKFGLLHVGKIHEWKRKKELMDLISNNDGTLAASDTSAVAGDVMEEFRTNARELLMFLKSIFIVLDTPAELVLQALSERPISLRRIEKDDWREIDGQLRRLLNPGDISAAEDMKLIKIIELGLIDRQEDYSQWVKLAAIKAGIPAKCFDMKLAALKYREPVWHRELGRMVFLK